MRLLLASHGTRCALLAWVASVSAGCGTEAPDAWGTQADPIVNGEASPDAQNAVVAIQYPDGRSFTGTLVAPTLVLTARHAVVTFADRTTAADLNCIDVLKGAPIGQNVPVDDLTVHFGSKTPLAPAISVARILSGGSLDLCENDVVLLQLAEPLDVEPLALRLEHETAAGEIGTLIGWGQTERDAGTRRFITPHGTRRQVQLTIETVGPGELQLARGAALPVPDSWFVTGPGACYGDSGAPFVSQTTGAVIGVWSTLERDGTGTEPWTLESCLLGRPAYRRLAAPRYAWLKDAFSAAGESPWYEGRARPAATGSSCQDDLECRSGRCLQAKSGSFCSQPCAAGECPAGMSCLVASSAPSARSWCVLDELDVAVAADSGCSASSSADRPTGGLGTPLLLLALVLGKRRRKSNRSSSLVRE